MIRNPKIQTLDKISIDTWRINASVTHHICMYGYKILISIHYLFPSQTPQKIVVLNTFARIRIPNRGWNVDLINRFMKLDAK